MKKVILILLLALVFVGGQDVAAKCCAGKCNAAPVRALELEIGVGMITPSNKIDFDKNRVGYNLLAEARYNFKKLPLDVGLRVDGDAFNREVKLDKNLFKFRSLNALLVFDLNINRKGIFSPFIGVGIGGGITSNQAMAIKDVTNQPIKQTVKGAAFCCTPRVGVELFHRARVTLYYKYQKLTNSHYGLSAGFVIGGGRK